jgi:hypothetical protein
MRERIRTRGQAVAARAGVASAQQVEVLLERLAVLEDEVQECRQLNLRLAELTDVVTELLLPVAQRDDAEVTEVLDRYRQGL